jgi:hypothetical protein
MKGLAYTAGRDCYDLSVGITKEVFVLWLYFALLGILL